MITAAEQLVRDRLALTEGRCRVCRREAILREDGRCLDCAEAAPA